MSKIKKDSIYPFAWIQPYQTEDDYVLAVWDPVNSCYELSDGDCYTLKELTKIWHPKWMRWADVEIAIASAPPNGQLNLT